MTFLAIDQFNPRSEEQQTAIRQLRRTFEKGPEKPFLSSKPTDKCFKCGEGHWAKECKKEIPHDSAGFKDNVAIHVPVDSMAT